MSTITINIPESLYDKLREIAERDNSTLEQLAVLAIAEKVSCLLTVEYLNGRARRAKPDRFDFLLSKVPDV
jgi:predicted DNA-binding ribbon-helix-helix protein